MTKTVHIVLVIIVLLFSTAAFAVDNEKRYEIPNHGVLVVNVPITWEDQIRHPPGDLPPTIRFTPESGEKFEIYFTPMWKTSTAPANFGTADNIKQMVKGAALSASSQAVERNIEVKKIKGANIGFYFSATDKAPKPGEYKYMSQGAIGVNEIVGTFTILTNSPNSSATETAIEMFGNLKHTR